ncbi:tyrosine-type recombinase/integrase [Halobaculum sp. D14]|uniref:tyrosine-type recombinase/integrase n=1 Tax=Halobaculum sp. D14 TaxID=3421642 RepID=UPI003EBBA944
MTGGGFGDMPDDPSDLTVHRATELFLESKSVDVTEKTVKDYRDRLRWFVNWCEENGIKTVGDLSGMAIDRARAARANEGVAPTTLKGMMVAINQLVDYLVGIGAVDEQLVESVDIPSLDTAEETSDTLLDEQTATNLLEFYRDSPGDYADAHHTFLELSWNTGARMGGLLALDLQDYDVINDDGAVSGGVLRFRHRPESETPLKNKTKGERVVRISKEVAEVLQYYIARDRSDKRDDHGREPLLCGHQGRPSESTLRAWSYLATQPCAYMACPHGEQRETCQFRKRNHASKCPSSRSPHQIRSGSITWQLNRGIPLEHVAERVNASPEVIARFYDKAADERKMRRREQYTEDLDINTEDES